MAEDNKKQPMTKPIILDGSKARKKRKKQKRLNTIAFLLIFAAAVVFIFRDEIDFGEIRLFFTGRSSPFSIQEHEGTVISGIFSMAESNCAVAYKNNIVLSNGNEVAVIREDGEVALRFQAIMQNPTIISSDQYFLIYDIGGTSIFVANSISIVQEIHTENPIITATINDRGEFAYATSSTKYRSEVFVHGSSLRQIYEWYSQSAYISALAISHNGERLAMAGATSNSGQFSTVFRVIDTAGEEHGEELFLPDELVFKLKWNGDEIISVSDKRMAIIDTVSNIIVNESSFLEGYTLIMATGHDSFVFAQSDYRAYGGVLIVSFDEETLEKTEFELAKLPASIYANGDKIVALYANYAEIYTKNGTLINEINDVLASTAVITDDMLVYIVEADEVLIYS